jgi:predicted amidohydrolase
VELTLRVAYIQTEPLIGQTKRNLDRAVDLIEKVHEADLIVLPELYHSGYRFESRAEAEALSCEIPGGDAIQALLYAARKSETYIAAGILERDGDALYNSAVLVNPSDVVLVYRKIHLFNDEKDLYKPGNEPPGTADIPPARGRKGSAAEVGMLICFDWVFPGAWSYLARHGAQIICHPANLVLEGKCEKGIVARAMENRVFIITADRVGEERGMRFVGGSQVVDPDGNVLSKAPVEGEYFDMVKIDPEAALDKYITPRNHVIDDARWELYPLAEKED